MRFQLQCGEKVGMWGIFLLLLLGIPCDITGAAERKKIVGAEGV